MKPANTSLKVLSVIVLALVSIGAQAAIEIECPEEIKTKQAIAAPIKGWEPFPDTTVNRQIFTGLQIYDGHPKEGAPIFEAPPATDTTAPKGADSATPPAETLYKIPAGRDAYVTCYYTGTLVRVTKKLPKGTQSCRVKFSETLGHVQKAVCE